MEGSDQRNPLEQFVENAHKRLQRIDVVLAELRQDGNAREQLGELASLFHNLAGTGGSYGFFEVSNHSRKGEALCNEILRHNRPATAQDLSTLRSLIEKINASLQNERAVALEALLERQGSTTEHPALSVVVLEWSDETREKWTSEVRKSGLPARGVSATDEFFASFQQAPDALIASADELSRTGFLFLKQLRMLPRGDKTVVILVGTLTDFHDKVSAIRQGADAYFEHKTDFSVVIDRLQELLQKRQPQGASILIVDDDPEQVTFLRAVLQPAGYHVHSCKDPRLFDQELALAKPELIIVDLMMPKITGTDLLRYVRQDETYRGVPIIVLSAVTNAAARSEASRAGGDVQLQKPVTAEVLLNTVAGCLESARRRGTVTAIEVLIK